MALITRLSRLLQADAHAVLDRIEEPELLLRQALREMERELDGAARQVRGLEQERERLGARDQTLRETLARIGEDLALCLDAGQDELARGLIRRRLETERALDDLARRRTGLDRELAERCETLAENRTRYEALRSRAETLLDDAQAEGRPRDTRDDAGNYAPISEQEIEVALLREKQRRARP